ncbi:MAG: class I SAM-dependent methyltransferase [Alphaproteobacteria bacterium]
MSELDRTFSGSIPEIYDRYLGPMLFEPYAADLAGRVADRGAGRVLETAAGTGIVTRALARVLPAAVAIVATDLNQAMLDFAAARAATGTITWRQADALSLPFEDGSFEVVMCQFGAMFFPDKRRAYREARRMLRPGGRFIFNVWDRIESNEIAGTVSEAVARLFPDDPPRFLVRTPYGYHEIATIERELRESGFRGVEAESVELACRAPSPREPAIGFCQGSPLRAEIEAQDAERLQAATDAAAKALARRFGPGPIAGSMRAHVVTASA